MFDLPAPVALVCHDAGAANLVFAWLKERASQVRPYMEGPAAALWKRAFPEQALCLSLDEALHGAAVLVSGTGWAALEHEARQLAHARGIRNVAVLDHWVNYAARFERNGQIRWPDEVWVADDYARQIASSALPGLPVRQFENLYLASQVACIRPAPGNGTLLYLLEPVRQTWGRDREGEFQALDYAFENIDRLIPGRVRRVLLRLHPSEPAHKYRDWLARHSQARLDESANVGDAISQADAVVGVESFALTIALAAGRPAYSSLPPWAPAIRLPHAGIRQIRYLSVI